MIRAVPTPTGVMWARELLYWPESIVTVEESIVTTVGSVDTRDTASGVVR